MLQGFLSLGASIKFNKCFVKALIFVDQSVIEINKTDTAESCSIK